MSDASKVAPTACLIARNIYHRFRCPYFVVREWTKSKAVCHRQYFSSRAHMVTLHFGKDNGMHAMQLRQAKMKKCESQCASNRSRTSFGNEHPLTLGHCATAVHCNIFQWEKPKFGSSLCFTLNHQNWLASLHWWPWKMCNFHRHRFDRGRPCIRKREIT